VEEVLAEDDLVSRPPPKSDAPSEEALRSRPSGNGVERFRSSQPGARTLVE
jgi:hypothetical protein